VNQGHATIKYFFDVSAASKNPKLAANWITQNVSGALNERSDLTIDSFPISSATLGSMIKRVQSGGLPSARASEVFQLLLESGSNDVDDAIKSLGIQKVDESELIALCEKLLAASPKTVADVKSGKLQAVGALIGQARKSNPNADPKRVREICLELIQTKM
jgi:aspartyl-tRNA(Asn)/glutamyl-tRNA(Gln) amidotransferase subunit B